MCKMEDNNSIINKIKRTDANGIDFCYARELYHALGYKVWHEFEKELLDAKIVCENSKINVNDHFVQVDKMINLPNSAKRKIKDYMLSIYACNLIHKKNIKINHFNVQIYNKPSNNINLSNYLENVTLDRYEKFYNKKFNENFIEKQKKRIKYNYELNMKYFNSLDVDEFNKYISGFVKKYKFVEVDDLNKYDGVSGIYIMVFDKYKQVYIGLSEAGIKKRIMKHWNYKKEPYKLIYGQAYNSIISVDSFGALDNTRIFVKTNCGFLFEFEQKIVNKFKAKYLLNRIDGGIGSIETYTDEKIFAIAAAITGSKDRDFSPFIDKKELYDNCDEYDIMMYESGNKIN